MSTISSLTVDKVAVAHEAEVSTWLAAPTLLSFATRSCWIYALEANNKVVYYCRISLFIIVVYHAITVLSGNFNTRVVYNNQVPGNALDTGSLVN